MTLPENNSRRGFLQRAGLGLLAAALPAPLAQGQTAPSTAKPAAGLPPGPAAAAESLRKLQAGNLRFQKGKLQHPDETLERRRDVAVKQAPFATVLACSDSRESPELLFDQGLGDLFVVRTAGHVLDNAVIGTLEFAVAELHVPLLVVMGHQRCGAIKATLDAVTTATLAPGQMEALVDAIRPALLLAQGEGDTRFTNVVKANVKVTIDRLQNSKLLSEAVAKQQLRIIGAYYQLDTGVAEFFA
ncbi:carbonic anhydrase [uncultured Hymenobacter sp.]|uniref:carbonic anhydrase n=1 Tax=uncultured Hymenobacter sp. TaxID=170016 RepID=UPI0035CA82B7